jgi:type II secretory pathway predicted ATPase ExeA
LSESPGTEPTLIGRAWEHASLREELATAIGGRGRLVLIGGEAGIGKTALAQRLAGEAAAQELRILSGHCYDLTKAHLGEDVRQALAAVIGQEVSLRLWAAVADLGDKALLAIVERLFISPDTARACAVIVLAKLQVESRLRAVVFPIPYGIELSR